MIRPGLTRFILALLVIFYHLSVSLFFGKFAVGCFFILSGYWIAVMYEKKYSKKRDPLKVFYISRFWRLLPSFYAFSLIAFLFFLAIGSSFMKDVLLLDGFGKIKLIISNIFILGYANAPKNLLAPTWSLDVELQFYLLFPLIYSFIKKDRTYIYMLLGIFSILALYCMTIDVSYILKTSLPYLYLFLIGVAIKIYKVSPGQNIYRSSIIVLILIVAVQYGIPSLRSLYRDETSVYYQLLSLVMTLIAIPILIKSIETRTDANDKFLGEFSFMIYLSHWIWLLPYNMLVSGASGLTKIAYVAVFFMFTGISSYLVYLFVDRPSEKLRQKWVADQP